MNYTDVDADRVLSLKTQIAGDLSRIAATRNVLKNQIISTLDIYWRGQSKDNFTAQFKAFLIAFDNFVKNIEALNSDLGKAALGYNRADDEARQFVISQLR